VAAAPHVRPFRRDDRAQLAELVNAHVGAVLPGVSLSVNAVLSQLERDPTEYVVDPWVAERATLVAVVRERVVAAAHLVRYAGDERVGEDYRDAGEVKWLVAWPDEAAAAAVLAEACVQRLLAWGAPRHFADGALPAPGMVGVPDAWPHVAAAYAAAGFAHRGREETLLLAEVADLPAPAAAPLPGLALRREVGAFGTRFVALLNGEPAGRLEAEGDLTAGGTLSRLAGWSELSELDVREPLRRRGLATWLVGAAAEWLRVAGARVALATTVGDETPDGEPFLRARGFRVLTRSRRGWERAPDA
jgi:GNAT superfamily N-acetyltransferase